MGNNQILLYPQPILLKSGVNASKIRKNKQQKSAPGIVLEADFFNKPLLKVPTTNPITPSTATPPTPAAGGQTPATATNPANTTPGSKDKKDDKTKNPDPNNKLGGSAASDLKKPSYMGPSSLKGQHLDKKAQDPSLSVQITVLNGDCAGKTFKIGQWLGVTVDEVSHNSGAEWSGAGEGGIRSKLNFSKLSDRKFNLKLQLYDFNEDITQLAENLEYLTAVTGDNKRPPLLTYKQGKLIMTPVVCLGISTTYKNAHIKDKGYKYAEVSLDFMLNAGRDSEHALGGPLAPTPLADELRSQTQKERQKEGRDEVIKTTLFACLGDKGNSQLKDLLSKDALGNVDSILALENTVFAQLAISGIIPVTVLQDPKVANKVKRDVASVLAYNEPGISDMEERKFAEALQGNSVVLSPTAQQQLAITKPAYEQIVKAISDQKLSPNDEVFKQQNQDAAERLRNMGSCGLRLRQTGAEQIKGDDPTKDNETLTKLKSLLDKANKGDISDKDLQKIFLTKTEAQLRVIKSRSPYVSKTDFLKRGSEVQSGEGSALVIWGNFETYLAKQKEEQLNKDKMPPAPTPK